MSRNHIYHVVPGKCGGSVKYQVYRDKLWGAMDGHIWTVVYKVVRSVRGLIVADIKYSTVASIAKNVGKGELTQKAAIECGCKRLVGARVESH